MQEQNQPFVPNPQDQTEQQTDWGQAPAFGEQPAGYQAPPPNAAQQAYYQPPFAGPPYAQQPFYSTPPIYQKKKNRLPLEQRDRVFIILCFVLALLGVICGAWGNFQGGFFAYAISLLLIFSGYLGKGNRFPGFFASLCGLLSLGLSTVFLFTTAPIIRLFSVLLLPCVSTVWFAGLAGRKVPSGDLGILSYLASVFAGGVGMIPKSITSFFSSENKKSKHTVKILIGILCALPVLLAVIPLLARSDEAFSNLLKKLFSDTGRSMFQIVLSVLFTPILAGYGLHLRKDPQKANRVSSFKGIDPIIVTSFLSVLSLVYLIYLFSQLAYFFSGFMGILPEGYDFSHAEYARRGFFELCAIAGINLAVLYASLLLAKKNEGKLTLLPRIPGTFIILYNLLLIVTAISKLALYIKAYGMTVLRIGTSAFAVFMAVVFLALLLRLYLPKVRVLSVALPAAACVLILLGVGNINRIVAEYNCRLYTSGKACEADLYYFRELGAEGVSVLTKLAEDEDETLAAEARENLYFALTEQYESTYHNDILVPNGTYTEYYTLGEKQYHKLSQFCLPRHQMYKETEAFLAAHPDFMMDEAKRIQAEWDSDFVDEAEDATTAEIPAEGETSAPAASTDN